MIIASGMTSFYLHNETMCLYNLYKNTPSLHVNFSLNKSMYISMSSISLLKCNKYIVIL